MKYQLVVFDMDGTILNTMDDLVATTNYALRVCGMPQKTRQEVQACVGYGLEVLLNKAVPEGTSKEEHQKMIDAYHTYYREHYADFTRPYEGIVQTIRRLREEGVKTAVVSNKSDYGVQLLARKYFCGLFDTARGMKEGMNCKPAPDAVLDVLRTLNVPAEHAVYVGDSDVDIFTANNAGMDCLSVTWGFRSESSLRQAGARHILHETHESADFVLTENQKEQ